MLALQTGTDQLLQDAAQERRLGVVVESTMPFNAKLPDGVRRIGCEMFETIRREIHQTDMPMGSVSSKLVDDGRVNPLQQCDGRTVLRLEGGNQVSQPHAAVSLLAMRLVVAGVLAADHGVSAALA